MKRAAVMIMTLLLSAVIISAQGQKKGQTQSKEVKKEQKTKMTPLKKMVGKDINPVAIDNFKVDFPNIQPTKWERSVYFDEAVFTKDGKNFRAFYDVDGKLVGTTSTVKFTDLPASAQRSIQKQYKDYTIGPVAFFDDNEANSSDMYLYGMQFEDSDNYFVELTKGSKKIVVQATPEGNIYFFTEMK
jgi:hypothetical protein